LRVGGAHVVINFPDLPFLAQTYDLKSSHGSGQSPANSTEVGAMELVGEFECTSDGAIDSVGKSEGRRDGPTVSVGVLDGRVDGTRYSVEALEGGNEGAAEFDG